MRLDLMTRFVLAVRQQRAGSGQRPTDACALRQRRAQLPHHLFAPRHPGTAHNHYLPQRPAAAAARANVTLYLQLPQAAGAAYGLKLAGASNVVIW
jgi:hypothetical protein